MTNADKMFEDLEYIKTENDYSISYNDESSKITGYTPVSFNKKDREIYLDTTVGMNLLKAINEKVKELGWYD